MSKKYLYNNIMSTEENGKSEDVRKPEEVSKSEPEEVVKLDDVTVESSKLLTLFRNLFQDQEKKVKIRVNLHLDEKEMALIEKIVDLVPELFDDLEKSVEKIYKDKVIDTKDIPELIVLSKNVYRKFSNSASLKKKVKSITVEESIQFIKNVLLILIEEEVIKVDKKKEISDVIDLCIDLLLTSMDMRTNVVDVFRKLKCW